MKRAILLLLLLSCIHTSEAYAGGNLRLSFRAGDIRAFGIAGGFNFGPETMILFNDSEKSNLFLLEFSIMYAPKQITDRVHQGIQIGTGILMNIFSPPKKYFIKMETGIRFEGLFYFTRRFKDFFINLELILIRATAQAYKINNKLVLCMFVEPVMGFTFRTYPRFDFGLTVQIQSGLRLEFL